MPVLESILAVTAIGAAVFAGVSAVKDGGELFKGCKSNSSKKVETYTFGGATAGQEERMLFAHGNRGGVAVATRPYRKR